MVYIITLLFITDNYAYTTCRRLGTIAIVYTKLYNLRKRTTGCQEHEFTPLPDKRDQKNLSRANSGVNVTVFKDFCVEYLQTIMF